MKQTLLLQITMRYDLLRLLESVQRRREILQSLKIKQRRSILSEKKRILMIHTLRHHHTMESDLLLQENQIQESLPFSIRLQGKNWLKQKINFEQREIMLQESLSLKESDIPFMILQELERKEKLMEQKKLPTIKPMQCLNIPGQLCFL